MELRSVISLLALIALPIGSGEIFDFHIINTRHTFHASEFLCQNLGYHGLAVVKSPEMYRYALRITEALRASQSHNGPQVGLRNVSDTGLVTWDDGSIPAEDTPWGTSAVAKDYINRPFTNIHSSGLILRAMKSDEMKPAICGYHKNLPTEAHGISLPGVEAAGVSSSLSLTTALSYLECVLLCGQDHRCRAAEYNKDSLTCKTFGPGSYTGVTPNSKSYMFVRYGF